MSYVIGLTGGIACGKSTVGALLAEHGLVRVDADQVAREVVEPGTPALREIVDQFGSGVVDADGRLDRAALGRAVFADQKARRSLEKIVHPRVWQRLKAAFEKAESQELETVLEIPLLFESGRQQHFQTIWVVSLPLEVQKLRLAQRDGLNPEEIEQRLASQWPLQEKERLAQLVIDNSGSQDELRSQVEQALAAWREGRG